MWRSRGRKDAYNIEATPETPLLSIWSLPVDEAGSLMDSLKNDPDLRDRIKLHIKVRQSGAAVDATVQVLSVALGSGGAGAALAGALSTWLSQRRADIKLTITGRNGRRIELEASRVRDVPELLDQVAKMVDEPDAIESE